MKYIISSGTSIISEIYFTLGESKIVITDNSDKALKYNTFGDAMKDCIKINNLIGKDIFKVMSIE